MKVKVCGLTRAEDAQLAVDLGAWALGFILYDRSPRAVAPEKIKELLGQLVVPKDRALLKTGVFVNADLSQIVKSVKSSGINSVQLHGDETADFSERVRDALPSVEVIKAIRPRALDDLRELPTLRKACHRILLDAYVPGVKGGGRRHSKLGSGHESHRNGARDFGGRTSCRKCFGSDRKDQACGRGCLERT